MSVVIPVSTKPLSKAYITNSYANYLTTRILYPRIFIEPNDFATGQDEDFYFKLSLDTKFRAAEENLIAEVHGLEWNLISRSKDDEVLNPIFEAALNNIKSFRSSRASIATNSIVKGMSLVQIIGKFVYKKLPGTDRKRRWFLPHRLVDIGRDAIRRTLTRIQGSNAYRFDWNIYNPLRLGWEVVSNEHDYIWSIYRPEEWTLGYGNGLGRSLYYCYRLKVVLTELLAGAAERFVDSWIIIQLENLRSTDNIYEDSKAIDTIIDRVEKMRAHGVGVFTGNGDIKTLSPGGAGYQLLTDTIEKCDRDMLILMTASNLPTDIAGGGSFAAAKVQGEQQNKRLLFQRETVISEPITDWLIPWIWRYNYHNFKSMGMQNLEPPEFHVSGGELNDTEERINVFNFAGKHGIEVADKDVRKQLSLTTPSDCDKIIEWGKQSDEIQQNTEGRIFSLSEIDKKLDKEDRDITPQALLDSIKEIELDWIDSLINKERRDSSDAIKNASELIRKIQIYYHLTGAEDAIEEIDST